MQSRDYIERLIQQIAAFVARIVGLATGGDSDMAEAERELDAAWSALGVRRGDALRLDDGTLRLLLGPKAALGAQLFEAQATLEEARIPGDHPMAEELRRRAAALRR
jgi:hypothetical protein